MLHRFASSLMRGVSGDDPDGGAGSGVRRRRSEPRRGRSGTPPAGPYGRAQASRWSAPVPHCRRRQHGSPAENRHGGAPRGRPGCNGTARVSLTRIVAPRTRDTEDECACRRSIHPSFGVRCKHEDTTRKPQGAAETKGEAMERAGTKAGVDESMTSSAPRASPGAAAQ